MSVLPATFVNADQYEEYRGTTLRVSWPALGHFTAGQAAIDEFERISGINVEVEAIPYLQLRDRQIKVMSQPAGDFDLVSWVIMWKGEYVDLGLLQPLEPFFENSKLADPTYDIVDIPRAYLVSGGMVGGDKGYLDGQGAVLYGLPYGAETSILAYRKDIFEKNGLSTPTTYDDLRNAILTLSYQDIPAMTSRGQSGNDITFSWLLHLAPLGGRIFSDGWEPLINSPEAIEATEFLRLVFRTGPEEMDTFNFGQETFEFLSGGAAISLDNFKIGAATRDQNFSTLGDQIGFAAHPSGAECRAETGGFSMGIPQNSQNKEAAFLLLQYLTSREGDLVTTQAGGDPIRFSTFSAVQAERAESSAIIGSLLCADTDWRPLIPEWNSIQNQVLGPALRRVVSSNDPIQAIMDDANTQLRALMEDAGYYN
jgi:multiple sugar transport system substrate-binding protein